MCKELHGSQSWEPAVVLVTEFLGARQEEHPRRPPLNVPRAREWRCCQEHRTGTDQMWVSCLGRRNKRTSGCSSVGQHEEPFNRVPPHYLEAFLRLCAACCRVAGFF